MSDPRRPRGCLHTNTSLEFPSVPERVLRIIAEGTRGIESAIHAVFHHHGPGPHRSARRHARMVLSHPEDRALLVKSGFHVEARTGKAHLERIVNEVWMYRDIIAQAGIARI